VERVAFSQAYLKVALETPVESYVKWLVNRRLITWFKQKKVTCAYVQRHRYLKSGEMGTDGASQDGIVVDVSRISARGSVAIAPGTIVQYPGLYEDADCTYSTGGANLAKSRDRVEKLLCSTIRNTLDKRSLKHSKRERYGSRPASLSAVKITRVRPRPNDSNVKLCVRGKLARLKANAKSRKAFLV
jgi:hypothetical protein